jgi:glycosyltransferase involved in cell wall biosynthesis
VFDVDRAPFLQRTRKGIETSRGALARFARIAASADLVTASNPYLAAHARRFTDDWRVKLLPEAVDLGAWRRRERTLDRGRLVLGWMGSPQSFPDLASLSDALRRLCDLFPGLELRVVSDAAPKLDGVRVTFARRDPAREAEEVERFDIALALYADDAISMGETPRELLAYLASGAPIVAGDTLAVRPILRDRRNSLLAQSPDEWERKIGLLIEAPELGRELGRGARETAEKIYAADRVARGLASILRSLERLPPHRGA